MTEQRYTVDLHAENLTLNDLCVFIQNLTDEIGFEPSTDTLDITTTKEEKET